MIGPRRAGLSTERGVTLLELMVSITVLSILSVLAVPAMVAVFRDSRMSSHVSDMFVSLQLVRSEAIKQNSKVTLCPSEDGEICLAQPHWERGWIVFGDPNSNGQVDPGEVTLLKRGALESEMTLRGSRSRLTFTGSGLSPGFNDTLRFCDPRGTDDAKRLVISMTGRVRVAKTAPLCP
jgi:type IV fimbrial biogenesis protein FimT